MSLSSLLLGSNLQPGVCTSSTRPSSPYEGQTIYETDTDRIMIHNGTGWVILSEPRIPYTPSAFGGLTGGTPSYVGDYHRSDGYCDFRITMTLGGTPSAISGLYAVLPFNTSYVATNQLQVVLYDNVGTTYGGYSTSVINSPNVGIWAWAANGTWLAGSGVSTINPFTWGSGDAIEVSGRFPMQTRHSFT